jgi:proteasome accessory factor C
MTDAQRYALTARALTILAAHPDGVRLADLAARLGASEDELRDEIAVYHLAGVAVDRLAGGFLEPVIEFVAGVGEYGTDDVPSSDGPFVRLSDVRPYGGTHTTLLSFAELAAVAVAGRQLLAQEPDDVLEAALATVADSVLAGPAPTESSWPEAVARRLRTAGAERRRVRITYATAWRTGAVDRVIEPYRVIRTRRGWEIDAAVVNRDSAIATFVASGIRSFEVLPDRFRRPPDIDQRIERHRRTVAVDMVVPYEARWAVELHAESAEVIDLEENLLRIRAHLLPPVASRLGLVLIAGGPEARVTAPANLRSAGRDVARALLTHHRGR